MGKIKRFLKRMNFWVRRKSQFALIALGLLIFLLLFINEDASLKLNYEFQEKINELKAGIKENEDSAAWYRARREALSVGTEELEHIAREEYHMQRPTEDVYIIKTKDSE